MKLQVKAGTVISTAQSGKEGIGVCVTKPTVQHIIEESDFNKNKQQSWICAITQTSARPTISFKTMTKTSLDFNFFSQDHLVGY